MHRDQNIPQRMCMICRQRLAKKDLKRFVSTSDASNKMSLKYDFSQKLPGRGYYLCMNEACQKKFCSSRGWQKKCKVGKVCQQR
jgi:predicted RNA-binding protein YlxR (DUF448 family)